MGKVKNMCNIDTSLKLNNEDSRNISRLWQLLYKVKKIEEVSNMLGVNLLGKLPLNPAYAEAADKGEFYGVDNSELEVAKEILDAYFGFGKYAQPQEVIEQGE